MEFKHTQLDNGLTVIAEVNPAAATMAAGFFVRAGSRDETSELAGVSHFLEHMMFKGTARRTAEDVNRELDEIGAQSNAMTSTESTIYYGAVLPEFQHRLLDLLADLMRPALAQGDFDLEKEVILQEIAMCDDSPSYRVYEGLMAAHFAGHPLGHSVRGTAASIGALTRGQMRDYFERRYCPGNVVAVAVGNIDYDAYVAQVAAQCGPWAARDVSRQGLPPPKGGGVKAVADPNVTREHVGLMSAAPSQQDDRRYAAALLAAVLGDTTGSRLYYALVDPALADEASTLYEAMDGAGIFMTFLTADAENAPEALDAARREIRKLQQEGPSESELRAAKNKIAAAATLRGEVPMGRLSAVGYDWIYRRQYATLTEEIGKLLAVTRGEVIDVVRTCDLTAATVLGLGPLESL